MTATLLQQFDAFAVTAPGLEALCAAEFDTLGIRGAAGDGGVAWRADAASLYRANLESRTASRILVRAGTFRARSFAELERRGAKLDWRAFIRPDTPVALRVTSRKSKLYHSDAVAERLSRVIGAEAGARDAGAAAADDEQAVAGVQLVVVRLLRDECVVSIDSSGALLHQRGYRQALAKAPLRETLAAALLLSAGWAGASPLVDPLCGSGTIPIEGALLARGIAPGLARPGFTPRAHAFAAWPGFDVALWEDVVAAARRRIRDTAGVPILGSDRNAGAITAARANAARAGVERDVAFSVQPLAKLVLPASPGHVVTNPPYGVRVGEGASLGPLYRALGGVLRERARGWTLTMLSADPRLDAAVGMPLTERARTVNGGIPVRIVTVTSRAGSGTRPVVDPGPPPGYHGS